MEPLHFKLNNFFQANLKRVDGCIGLSEHVANLVHPELGWSQRGLDRNRTQVNVNINRGTIRLKDKLTDEHMDSSHYISNALLIQDNQQKH